MSAVYLLAVYLVDGKPHRICDCDESSEACPKGRKRGLMTCGFDRCLVPAPEVLIAGDMQSEKEAICQKCQKPFYTSDEIHQL